MVNNVAFDQWWMGVCSDLVNGPRQGAAHMGWNAAHEHLARTPTVPEPERLRIRQSVDEAARYLDGIFEDAPTDEEKA